MSPGADESEQREAEHIAASLHALGWEAGAGATIWARVIRDELDRHDAAGRRFASDSADLEAWERLHGSVFVLVVAIAQVLAFEARIRELTGNAESFKARQRFDSSGPRAGALRDIATHLDAYAIGDGDRQTGRGHKHEPPIAEHHVEPFVSWTDAPGGTMLDLGGDAINLHAAANAALALDNMDGRSVRLWR
jgi:hypothetical protein